MTRNFSDTIMNSVAPGSQFRPFAHYDPDGDSLQVIERADTYHGVRIDSLLTVYISEENGEVVGFLLKGLRKLIKEAGDQLPGFLADAVEDSRVSVDAALSAHLFLTRPPENAEHLRYRRQARRVAGRTDSFAEVPAPC